MQMDFRKFSRNNMYVGIPGKLSEVHLHACLFSNPCRKVLVIVGISYVNMKQMGLFFLVVELHSEVSVINRATPSGSWYILNKKGISNCISSSKLYKACERDF